MIKEVGSIAVTVSNKDKAKRWYEEKLGFEILDEMGHWVVVAPPNSTTGIHLCETKKLEPGNTGILLYTDDIEATCKELKKKGVKFTRALGKAEWDERLTYAKFKDPDGNEYWLEPARLHIRYYDHPDHD